MVLHEYFRCTPWNSVTTVTTMQLATLTAAFLKAVSSFLHPATLQPITHWQCHARAASSGRPDSDGDSAHRILLMYEDSNERLSLRRAYIKN